jgi:hypothetical protein
VTTGRVGLVLSGLLLCTGCFGGSTPPPATTTTAAVTSPTPSQTTPPPTLPPDATKATPDGAVAFFRYFWDVYNYSYSALDTTELRRISESTCKFCLDSANAIDARKREGGHYVGGTVTVTTAVAAPGDVQVGLLVNSVVDQAMSSAVSAGGTIVSSSPAETGLRVDAAVLWKQATWRMLGVKSLNPKGTP